MRTFVAIAAGLLVTGCSPTFFNSFGSLFMTEEARQAKNAPSIPFTSRVRTGSGNITTDGYTTVLRSQAELEALLASHRATVLSAYLLEPNLPLDFAREQGVFLLDRPYRDGGGSIEIVAIEERADRFVVRSIRWLAPPGQSVTLAVQQPLHYVSMVRSEKPVEFAEPVEAYTGSLN
ncbi:hypothetical protein D3C72_177490 [compost metagenome]